MKRVRVADSLLLFALLLITLPWVYTGLSTFADDGPPQPQGFNPGEALPMPTLTDQETALAVEVLTRDLSARFAGNSFEILDVAPWIEQQTKVGAFFRIGFTNPVSIGSDFPTIQYAVDDARVFHTVDQAKYEECRAPQGWKHFHVLVDFQRGEVMDMHIGPTNSLPNESDRDLPLSYEHCEAKS